MTSNKSAGQRIRLPKIIYRPDLQSVRRRHLYAGISVVAWLVWLYLFVPLLTLVVWAFGVHRFDDYLLKSPANSAHVFLIYGAIIVAVGIAFLLWATYNLLRFRGKDRRATPDAVTASETAAYFGLQADQIGVLRTLQVVRVHHDETGAIIRIDPPSPIA
ncbi:poly-beta-1,6-N-acetyl-D-glucosamine biosynthesis protein PgaD [Rhodanobacter ginsengiterrae]|uniref:poly-beta-1,6-N-acetyl-D-glucosamine biosynthesis protein PgaD n=1 Tax=Rhodanobacter ginsengiterrae TaxID=2008451 RepID=UPI003CF309B8